MQIKKLLLVVSILLLLAGVATAETFVDYGFEDWTGDNNTTPGYIFGSSSHVYCDNHEACTTVVSDYDGLLPYSGNYFFIRAGNTETVMSPSVSGITESSCTLDSHYSQYGYDINVCGNNDFIVNDDSHTYYIEYRMAMPPWVFPQGVLFKFFWFDSVDSAAPYWTMTRDISDGSVQLFASGVNPITGDSEKQYNDVNGDTMTMTDYLDGTWHKFAWYIDWSPTNTVVQSGANAGKTEVYQYMWLDEDNPTLATTGDHPREGNYVFYVMEAIDVGYDASVIHAGGNWSGIDPGANSWYIAIDNVKVMDGLPTGTLPNVACQSDDTTANDSYPFTATYTLDGVRTVSSCTWSNSLGGTGSCTATGGNITGTATGLSVGDNVITIELIDSETETGNCNFTVTQQTPVGSGTTTVVNSGLTTMVNSGLTTQQ